jgi:hypothetical protein
MLLINLILTELIICLFGIPMDLVATVHGGWWMGEELCVATGFILTVLGIVKEDSEQMAPSYLLTHEHQSANTVKFCSVITIVQKYINVN